MSYSDEITKPPVFDAAARPVKFIAGEAPAFDEPEIRAFMLRAAESRPGVLRAWWAGSVLFAERAPVLQAESPRRSISSPFQISESALARAVREVQSLLAEDPASTATGEVWT